MIQDCIIDYLGANRFGSYSSTLLSKGYVLIAVRHNIVIVIKDTVIDVYSASDRFAATNCVKLAGLLR